MPSFLSSSSQANPQPIVTAPLIADSSQLAANGQIAYDLPNGKLWSMPVAAGATAEPLFRLEAGTFAFQPVWSASTQQIAYGYIQPNAESGKLVSARLWVADINGTNPRQITQSSEDFEGTYRDPAWSPDGSALWATVQLPQKDERGVIRFRSEIRRIPLGNGLATDSETVIIKNGRGPALSPDNRWIAYLAADDENSGSTAIWRARIDGSEAQRLVAGDQFEEFYVPMRFSPDGQTLAFAAADADNQLQRTPPPSSSWLGQPTQWLDAFFNIHVAYAHGLFPADVWLVNVETGRLARLTQLSEDHPTPVWSPDGRHLAFAGVLGLYLVDVENRNAVRITEQGIDGQIEWIERTE